MALAVSGWFGIALSGCVAEPGYLGAYGGPYYPPAYLAPAYPYAYPTPFYGSLGLFFGGGHRGFDHRQRFDRPDAFQHRGHRGFHRQGGHSGGRHHGREHH